jgi:hypothetical protein
LALNTIFTWAQLEQKFHEYFYSRDSEIRLSHLTAIKQKHNEPIVEYVRRFRDIRNRCFNLNISDMDLAYAGLSPHFKEKLGSHDFLLLDKSCKGLWILKTKPKNLEVLLEPVISLGMIVILSTWLNTGVSHRTMRMPMCV